MTSLRLLGAGISLLVLAACGSDKTTANPGAGGDTSAAGGAASDGDSGGKQPVPSCPKGGNPRGDAKPVALGTITGQLTDESGEPTSAGLVQVCGRDICINARVGTNGKLSEQVDQTLDSPACKWGDGFDWVKLALPLAAGDTDLGALTAVRLPSYADAVPLAPGKSVSSGGVTLTLDPSAKVVVNSLDYETEEQRGFRAAALTGAALTQLGQDFVVAFGLSPLETRICPSPALSLENAAGLAAGTELELYLLGLDVEESWAPYGQWLKVGEGTVSEDGSRLEFADGVPVLTAIGVKVKP